MKLGGGGGAMVDVAVPGKARRNSREKRVLHPTDIHVINGYITLV